MSQITYSQSAIKQLPRPRSFNFHDCSILHSLMSFELIPTFLQIIFVPALCLNDALSTVMRGLCKSALQFGTYSGEDCTPRCRDDLGR